MDHPRDMTIAALMVLFLAIGAYHFAFFLGRRRARENLWFALLCALAALYGATSGVAFAEATMELVNPYRVRLLAMVLAGPVYLALLVRLFDLRIGWGARGGVLLFLLLVPLVALLPLSVLAVLHRGIGVIVGLGLAATTVWAWARGYPRGTHARVMLGGTIAFSGAVGYDLLSEFGLAPVAQLLPGVPGMFWIGFVLFLGAIGTQTAGRFAQAEAQAGTDPLTSLARRHVVEEALAREAERCRRTGGNLILVVLDLDHFKQINDTYGHRAGDVVLERVGHLLRHSARNIDLPARLGGEEFAVLLADTDEEGAVAFADRFRQRLHQLQVAVPGGEVRGMTASVGIVVSGGWNDAAVLLDDADRAMYRAKQAGRDRVVVARLVDPSVARAT